MVTFLDLKVSIRDKGLVTDLFRKSTATNSLLRSLTTRFRQRSYLKKTISRAFQRAKGLNQDLLISSSDRHQDRSVRFITDYNDQWNQKIQLNARGGNHRKRLLQIESRWIFKLRSLSPTGLNEQLLFTSFLG
ncbi:uncharacterized protein LOC143776284 isoform X2 [Ranitomeya variabilis]|uniref:uncharacterized protein LOC143776284 isoform X2 n=1 Tax=Ranitomeya variabilis TaxID=490064 RepID=UPI0040560E9D